MKIFGASAVDRQKTYQSYREDAQWLLELGNRPGATDQDRDLFEAGVTDMEAALQRRTLAHQLQDVANVGVIAGGVGLLFRIAPPLSAAALMVGLGLGVGATAYESSMEAFPLNEAIKAQPEISQRVQDLQGFT